MTEYEKQQIQEMRLEGIGYKAIANLMGMTRDNVRSFCKRNGLEGDAVVVALNVEEKIENNIVCAHCGKPIEQKGKGRLRKFCSDFCRRRWWSVNPQHRKKSDTAIYHFTCKHCGKEFDVYGNKYRKYCSHNCYIKARFWEDEDGIQEDSN